MILGNLNLNSYRNSNFRMASQDFYQNKKRLKLMGNKDVT